MPFGPANQVKPDLPPPGYTNLYGQPTPPQGYAWRIAGDADVWHPIFQSRMASADKYADRWELFELSADTSLWGRVIDAGIVTIASAVNPVAGAIAKIVIQSSNAPPPRPIRTALPVPKPRARISAALAAY